MTQQNERRGLAMAGQILGSGGYYQHRLRLQAGDRARFYFLTSGWDDFIGVGRFHDDPDPERYDKHLCVRNRGGGEECSYCAQGYKDTGGQFAAWVWVDHILHASDNPDPEGAPWKQVQVKETRKVAFQEILRKPMLIWMGLGRGRAWFDQFYRPAARYGSLQLHLYELSRVGSGMQDTDYTLKDIRESAVPENVVALVSELPTIEDVFRATLGQPMPAAKVAPNSATPGGVVASSEEWGLGGLDEEVSLDLEEV